MDELFGYADGMPSHLVDDAGMFGSADYARSLPQHMGGVGGEAISFAPGMPTHLGESVAVNHAATMDQKFAQVAAVQQAAQQRQANADAYGWHGPSWTQALAFTQELRKAQELAQSGQTYAARKKYEAALGRTMHVNGAILQEAERLLAKSRQVLSTIELQLQGISGAQAQAMVVGLDGVGDAASNGAVSAAIDLKDPNYKETAISWKHLIYLGLAGGALWLAHKHISKDSSDEEEALDLADLAELED